MFGWRTKKQNEGRKELMKIREKGGEYKLQIEQNSALERK